MFIVVSVGCGFYSSIDAACRIYEKQLYKFYPILNDKYGKQQLREEYVASQPELFLALPACLGPAPLSLSLDDPSPPEHNPLPVLFYIQHCIICRPSDSTVLLDAGIKPRTVATLALADSRCNHSPDLVYKSQIG
jgi:hypothetical protein